MIFAVMVYERTSVKCEQIIRICSQLYRNLDIYEEHEIFYNYLELFCNFLVLAQECREACADGETD